MKRISLIIILFIGTCLCYGQPSKDNIKYKHIKGDFYSDSIGNLYYKYLFHDDDQKTYTRYTDRMPLTNWEKYDSLKKFIDVQSYTKIGSYAKDKRYVYYFIYNSDGTTMRILSGADASTFTTYKQEGGWDFGCDKNFVYQHSGIVEGCDPKAKLTFFKSADCTCYNYFTNGKIVFYNSLPIKNSDPKTFKMVNAKNYEAEDKTGKYLYGKRIGK